MILLLISTLWCGAIGFTDDYIKVFKKRKEGLSERAKLIGQVTLGFIIGLTVWMDSDIKVFQKQDVSSKVKALTEEVSAVPGEENFVDEAEAV